jgi:hypothetical protein
MRLPSAHRLAIFTLHPVTLEIRPEPSDAELEAIERALATSAEEADVPAAYASAWRRAALLEATDADERP